METLEVKNFGPLVDINLDIKDFNVFIGPTSSGKSTASKLICIFQDLEFLIKPNLERFKRFLIKYNIDFEIVPTTYLRYSNGDFNWVIEKGKFKTTFPYDTLIETFRPFSIEFLTLKKGEEFEKLKNSKFLYYFFKNHEFYKTEIPKRKSDDSDINYALSELKQLLKTWPSMDNPENLDKVNQNFNFLFRKIREERKYYEPLFIPAERMILSMVSKSIYSFLNNDIPVAESLLDFGSRFETARKQRKFFDIEFLKAKYNYKDDSGFLSLPGNKKILLEKASSGFQSLIPMYVVTEAFLSDKSDFNFLLAIEEPELNLYPSLQAKLMEYLVEKQRSSGAKMVITTHSPYILTALDNLIQAKNVVKIKKEMQSEVNKIIPSNKWLDFDTVSCYFFENGTCYSTLDEENRSIGASKIDDISDVLSKTYESLLDLEFGPSHVL